MIEVRLSRISDSDSERTQLTFNLPSSLSEMPLKKYVEFLVNCRDMTFEEGGNYVQKMVSAVSDFTGKPIAEFLGADFEVHHGGMKSVAQVFGHLSGLCSGKSSRLPDKSALFEYRGDKYLLPAIARQVLSGESLLPPMSVIEMVEVAEIQRLRVQKVASVADPDGGMRRRVSETAKSLGLSVADAERVTTAEIEKAGDPSGSLLYTMFLRMLAIIARKEGEELPFDDAKREAWISERAVYFQDIDAKTALDVDFFLTSTFPNSKKSLLAIGFLSLQSFALQAEMRLKRRRRKTGRSSTTNRSLKE